MHERRRIEAETGVRLVSKGKVATHFNSYHVSHPCVPSFNDDLPHRHHDLALAHVHPAMWQPRTRLQVEATGIDVQVLDTLLKTLPLSAHCSRSRSCSLKLKCTGALRLGRLYNTYVCTRDDKTSFTLQA
jgi:hypothetical protein